MSMSENKSKCKRRSKRMVDLLEEDTQLHKANLIMSLD